MKTLGRFAYHKLLFTFEGNEAAGTYIVQLDFSSRVETKAFKDAVGIDALSRARQFFETAVHQALLATSRSDVQLYLQNGEVLVLNFGE